MLLNQINHYLYFESLQKTSLRRRKLQRPRMLQSPRMLLNLRRHQRQRRPSLLPSLPQKQLLQSQWKQRMMLRRARVRIKLSAPRKLSCTACMTSVFASNVHLYTSVARRHLSSRVHQSTHRKALPRESGWYHLLISLWCLNCYLFTLQLSKFHCEFNGLKLVIESCMPAPKSYSHDVTFQLSLNCCYLYSFLNMIII